MKRFNSRLAPLCLMASAAMVGAQTPPMRTGQHTPNFVNQDISLVAEAVGAAIGRTFIPDARVRANITLSVPAGTPPWNSQQLYANFLAVLAQNGFSVVPAGGNTLKIVPEGNARTMPGNDLPSGGGLAPDDVVTDVLEAKNVSVQQVAQVLRQFMGQAGQIQPVPGTPYMIVTDRASNVARLKKLLSTVDKSPTTNDQMIPLQNALASEVVKTLTPLLQGQPADAASGTAPPRVQADDRTNKIIVSGDAAQRLRIAALIQELDVAVSTGGGMEVVELKYAKATELATTLTNFVNGTATTTTGGGGAAGGAPAAPSVAANADRSTKITAHEATNKLIITAAPRTLVVLKDIIGALDVPPDQVLIEAIVAELTDGQAADLGVNWAVFSTDGNTNVPISGFISPVAGASLGELASTVVDVQTSVANGALPQGATFGVGKVKDTGVSFAAMLRALNTDVKSNIVSLPKVTATNNQEAEMKAGQQVPFVTGQYTNSNGGGGGGGGNGNVNPFTTVNREDVGTTLKVTPQIIAGNDEVILKIELTSSSLSGKSGDAGSLITNTRSVKTNVRVHSGGMIVIGGMIKSDSDATETRVPLLSRIPFFGELFRTRGGSHEKTNMMVFIQPKILHDAIQANAETATLYNQIRDSEKKLGSRKEVLRILPKDSDPSLPEMPPPPPAVTPTAPAKP